MVKNTKGGHHKNQARKDSYVSSAKTRLSMDPYEVYAKVIKLFGGNQCDVITINGDTLRCIIRGKFSGKFKRANIIAINSFVLIGIRDWASNANTADLIDIYSNSDISSLPNNPFFISSFTPIPSIDYHYHNLLDNHIDNHIDNLLDLDLI
jgi:hypothetical protein